MKTAIFVMFAVCLAVSAKPASSGWLFDSKSDQMKAEAAADVYTKNAELLREITRENAAIVSQLAEIGLKVIPADTETNDTASKALTVFSAFTLGVCVVFLIFWDRLFRKKDSGKVNDDEGFVKVRREDFMEMIGIIRKSEIERAANYGMVKAPPSKYLLEG